MIPTAPFRMGAVDKNNIEHYPNNLRGEFWFYGHGKYLDVRSYSAIIRNKITILYISKLQSMYLALKKYILPYIHTCVRAHVLCGITEIERK